MVGFFFFITVESYPTVRKHHVFLIHPSTRGQRLLPRLDSCACCCMNVGGWVSRGDSDFNFFGYIPRNGIAGTHGSSIFNFVRNPHPVSHSGCAGSHAHQQRTGAPCSPLSHSHYNHPDGASPSLTAALTRTSQMARDADHCATRLPPTHACMSSRQKLSSSAHFLK